MRRRLCFPLWLAIPCIAAIVTAGCTEPRQLVLASTTSTEDSGLFTSLLPAFAEAHPDIVVRLVAVGTGQALELGRRGDADVLLVHSPAAESLFVAQGHGTHRCLVMYNDFVLLGPHADPAGIRGMTDALQALRAIADAHAPFVSRGDDSGTHRREIELWQMAGMTPAGEWYLEAGQGMGEVLSIAGEKGAYTVSDRATYLSMRDRLGLELLAAGDARLFNQYAVIPVADAANRDDAAAFAAWVTSPTAQRLIGEFGVSEFGQRLFTPNAAGVCDGS